MKELLEMIDEVLGEAQTQNREGSPLRSRELSLAITKLEEARFWLKAAPDTV